MTLAGMLAEDRNALICDLAETYQIYDYKRVPVKTLGILAAGLREDSRIRQKLEGIKASPDTILLARVYDLINVLVWSKTKDAEKGKNFPKSLALLFMEEDEEESKAAHFSTGAEYEEARKKIIEKIKGAEQ